MEQRDLSIKVEPQSSGCGCCSGASEAGTETAAVDPVCGMTVDRATAPATSTHEGQTYYFCASGCARAFDKDPTGFLSPAA